MIDLRLQNSLDILREQVFEVKELSSKGEFSHIFSHNYSLLFETVNRVLEIVDDPPRTDVIMDDYQYGVISGTRTLSEQILKTIDDIFSGKVLFPEDVRAVAAAKALHNDAWPNSPWDQMATTYRQEMIRQARVALNAADRVS